MKSRLRARSHPSAAGVITPPTEEPLCVLDMVLSAGGFIPGSHGNTQRKQFFDFSEAGKQHEAAVLPKLSKHGAKHGVHTYADDVNPSVVSCRIRAVAPETLVNICQDNKVKEGGASGSGWQNPCSTKREEADKTNFLMNISM